MLFLFFLLCIHSCKAWEYTFQGIPTHRASAVENTIRLQSDLDRLVSGDVYTLPKHTYYIVGGLRLHHRENVTLVIDATLHFSTRSYQCPTDEKNQYLPCMSFVNVSHIRITSNSQGIWNGEGYAWWNIWPLNHRRFPKIWTILDSHHIQVDHITFLYAPYWTVWVENTSHVHLSHLHLLMKRSSARYHTWVDALDTHTHGIFLQGKHLHLSNSTVWGEGHSVLIRGDSAHVTVRQVNLSGRGLTLVSKYNQSIRYVDVQDVYFYKSLYGIIVYVDGEGYIEHVRVDSITMDENRDWSIWVQSHSHCRDLLFQCDLSPLYVFFNLTFTRIRLHNPRWNPGFILGDTLYAIYMENLTYTYAPLTTESFVYHAFPTLRSHTPSPLFAFVWILVAIACASLLLYLFTDIVLQYTLLLFLLLCVFQHYYFGSLSGFIACDGVYLSNC